MTRPHPPLAFLLSVGSRRWVLPAERVLRIAPPGLVNGVPGSGLGMTLLDGEVCPVLSLEGSDPAAKTALVVCRTGAGAVAVRGASVERAPKPEAMSDATPLDLDALLDEHQRRADG